jgi:hypothetical protein
MLVLIECYVGIITTVKFSDRITVLSDISAFKMLCCGNVHSRCVE